MTAWKGSDGKMTSDISLNVRFSKSSRGVVRGI